MAREYPVKKGIKMSNEYILEQAKKFVESAEIKDDKVHASLPGMKSLELYTNGKTLFAQTENDHSYNDVAKTIKLFNDIIETITGFNSKERKKRMSKL